MQLFSNTQRSLLVAAWLMAVPLKRGQAEDRADFKFSYYLEDNSRVEVYSPALLLETDVGPNTIMRLQAVYDVLSGATPTGEPLTRKTREVPTAGSSQGPGTVTSYSLVSGPSGSVIRVPVRKVVSQGATDSSESNLEPYGDYFLPMTEFQDERLAVNLELEHRLEDLIFTGGLAHSTESDYDSYAVSGKVGREFNEKNTLVTIGGAYTYDDVLNLGNGGAWDKKETVEGMIGLTQVLDARTLLTLNYVGATASGFLNDTYKLVMLNDEVVHEKRPAQRDKHIAYLALQRFIDPLNGSLEASYRYYTDTYGTDANTLGLAWYQKLGKNWIIVPSIRYYEQSAADFYKTEFTGNPTHYSADYRLSKLGSITYGMKVVWKMHERFSMDLAYDRYEQWGRDQQTPGEAYPSANIVTLGLKVWF